MRALSSIPVLVSALLIATACNTPTDEGRVDFGVGRLTVIPSATTVMAGGQIQLHFTAQDKDGLATTPTGIIWATSDPRVATVAPDGLVTGHANGASQITALWGGVHGQSTVTVVNSILSSIPCSTSGANERALSTGNDDQPPAQIKKACVTR
jgi:hypothetical protein